MQRQSDNAAKLAALKEAAKLGMASIESGAAQRFDDFDALRRHLQQIATRVVRLNKRA